MQKLWRRMIIFISTIIFVMVVCATILPTIVDYFRLSTVDIRRMKVQDQLTQMYSKDFIDKVVYYYKLYGSNSISEWNSIATNPQLSNLENSFSTLTSSKKYGLIIEIKSIKIIEYTPKLAKVSVCGWLSADTSTNVADYFRVPIQRLLIFIYDLDRWKIGLDFDFTDHRTADRDYQSLTPEEQAYVGDLQILFYESGICSFSSNS